MKIGFVIDDSLDRPDGVQQYVLALGSWLAAQGHDVHYLAGQTSRDDIPNVHSLAKNVSVRFNGNGLSVPLPVSRRMLRRFLAVEKFDVLHVQMPYSPMFAARVVMAAPASSVIVGTFHILPYDRFVTKATKMLGFALRRSLRRFDQVFAVSSSAAAFASQAFSLEQVSVLPNVVDVTRFARAEPIRDAAAVARKRLVFLGRLVQRKGCSTFLHAVAELSEMYDGPLEVVVAGKGPLAESLHDEAGSLGIGDVVDFIGFVPEDAKPELLKSADLAVYPSLGGESFGIVLLEAMASSSAASGPVVLAADNPGYRTVLEPRPSQLFAPGDSKALAGRMKRYLTSPDDVSQVRRWQEMYVRQFDVSTVGRRLVAVYTANLRKRLRP